MHIQQSARFVCFLFLLCASFIPLSVQGQQRHLTCGFDQALRKLEADNPLFAERRQAAERHWAEQGKRPPQKRANPIVLPVVFHVIQQGTQGQLSDAEINATLGLLNQAFSNQAPYGKKGGADAGFQFCLAQRTPDLQLTNGITRTESALTVMDKEQQDLDVKGLIRWNPECYINIWVVAEINSASGGNGVAGYAYFPQTHGDAVDGIVIESRFIDGDPQNTVVLIHEMGHYLGLYHTFEGGCSNGDCMTEGDRVCDTPPDQSTAYTDCTLGMNTCNTDANSGFPTDVPDAIENFMDYSDLPCYDHFTADQGTRMNTLFQQYRTSLLNCKSCLPLCNDPVSAAFSITPQPLPIGTPCQPGNNSSANALNFEWYIDGVLSSQVGSPTFNFNIPGTYQVVLIAFGSDPSICLDIDTLYLEVICPFQAGIDPQPLGCIEPDSSITFQYTGLNGAALRWLIDGQQVGTGNTYSPILPPGAYALSLVSSGPLCADTSSWTLLLGCQEICDNNIDDDGDGLVDCFDPDCCGYCEDFYFDPCGLDSVCTHDPCNELSVQLKWSMGGPLSHLYTPYCGDMDGDGKTEFLLYNDINAQLQLADYDTKVLTQIGPTQISGGQTMAMADTDLDGFAEIYMVNFSGFLIGMEHTGQVKFTSTAPFLPPGNNFLSTRIHIHDIDQDGKPEIISGNRVFDSQTGALLASGGVNVSMGRLGFTYASCEAVADVIPRQPNGTGQGLEIVTGNQVLGVNWANGSIDILSSVAGELDGAAAIVDWDGDGDLDVVAASQKRLIIWDARSGQLLDSYDQPYDHSSSPAVGNFDADPELEIAIPISLGDGQHFALLVLDHNLSLMWQLDLEELTGVPAILFDFCDDEASEIVIHDRFNMYILRGSDGHILYQTDCFSATANEHPVIADVDGDGHAELVCICANAPFSNANTLRVYEGGAEKWAKTRPIWNQYSFYNTHINDDLTIPRYQQATEIPDRDQGLNTFMEAFSYSDKRDSIDFVVTLDSSRCQSNSYQWYLRICNTGTGTQAAGSIPYAFYSGPPDSAWTVLLGQASASIPSLTPGACTHISLFSDLNWFMPGQGIWLQWNDPALLTPPFNPQQALQSTNGECDFVFNSAEVAAIPLLQAPDLGPDTIICSSTVLHLSVEATWPYISWSDGTFSNQYLVQQEGWHWVEVSDGCQTLRDSILVSFESSNMTLDLPAQLDICPGGLVRIEATPGFSEYSWQDGLPEEVYTAWQPGLYWVEVTDACGFKLRDSVLVVKLSMPDPGLADTLRTCPGKVLTLNTSVYPQHYWETTQPLSCNTCASPQVTVNTESWIYYKGLSDQGCFIEDSIWLEVRDAPSIEDTFLLCQQDSILVGNQWIQQAGEFDLQIPGLGTDCDTLLKAVVLTTPQGALSLNICMGDSVQVGGQWFKEAGHFQLVLPADPGTCDSLIALEVQVVARQTLLRQESLCPGDSIWIDGNWQKQPGVFDSLIEGQAGNCDTLLRQQIDFSPASDIASKSEWNCQDASGQILVSASGNGPYTYQWTDPQELDSLGQSLAAGNYSITLTDASGCIFEVSSTLQPDPLLHFDIPLQYTLSPSTPALITVQGDTLEQGLGITWAPALPGFCPDCFSQWLSIAQETALQITLTDSNGCVYNLNTLLQIAEPQGDIFLPTGFSPNGDGTNDHWQIFANQQIDHCRIYVFDRWGDVLYYSDADLQAGVNDLWDGSFKGKPLNPGVYVYQVEGRKPNGEEIFFSGEMVLMR